MPPGLQGLSVHVARFSKLVHCVFNKFKIDRDPHHIETCNES